MACGLILYRRLMTSAMQVKDGIRRRKVWVCYPPSKILFLFSFFNPLHHRHHHQPCIANVSAVRGNFSSATNKWFVSGLVVIACFAKFLFKLSVLFDVLYFSLRLFAKDERKKYLQLHYSSRQDFLCITGKLKGASLFCEMQASFHFSFGRYRVDS